MQQILILCPVYNDEACLRLFAAQLEEQLKPLHGFQFCLLVVNDGSITKPKLESSLPLTLLHLYRNIGHQKAVAIGLSYAYHHLQFDKIIIMDADGEDNPGDINTLLKASSSNRIVFAQRASRQNGRRFKTFYGIYKFLFRILTGHKISFGNFMLLPKQEIARLVHTNEIWNHLASAIIKSKAHYSTIATHRGKRLSGSTKMSFTALILHGLGAIGVFIEIIATRLLVFSIAMILVAVLAIVIIVCIRLFTDAAIPGWATTAFSSMLIVLLQGCLLSLFTIFLYLSSQSQRKFIPAHHYKDYMESVEYSNQILDK